MSSVRRVRRVHSWVHWQLKLKRRFCVIGRKRAC